MKSHDLNTLTLSIANASNITFAEARRELSRRGAFVRQTNRRRLIAASPCLLAALEVLLDCAADLDQSATANGMKNCDALAKSRAAIRKATGGAK